MRSFLINIFEPLNDPSFVLMQKKLRKTRNFSKEELEDLQLEKLNSLLNHFKSYNPWYSELIKNVKLSNLDDLRILPIVEKEELKDQYESLKELAINSGFSFQIARSGGTSGSPVQVLLGNKTRKMALAAFYEFYTNWGIKIGDPKFILWGQHSPFISKSSLVQKVKYWLKNYKLENTFYLDENRLSEIYNNAYKFNAKVLRGYTSSIIALYEFMEKHDLAIWSKLKMISCTAEKLTEDARNKLETFFKVPVSNQYWCGEVNSIASDCFQYKRLHVEQEHVILETVDDDGNNVFDKPGHILITDLDNYLTPIIRYRVGDMGVITRRNCECGRAHMVISDIIGRTSDIIELSNGRIIGPAYFSVLLRDVEQIKKACIRVMNPSHLQIDLQLSKPIPTDHLAYTQNALRTQVGIDVVTEWRSVTSIPPVKSGKSPWVRYLGQEYSEPLVLEVLPDYSK